MGPDQQEYAQHADSRRSLKASGDGLFVAVCVGRKIRDEAMRLVAGSSEVREYYPAALPHYEGMARFDRISAFDCPQSRVDRPVAFGAAIPDFTHSQAFHVLSREIDPLQLSYGRSSCAIFDYVAARMAGLIIAGRWMPRLRGGET